MFSANNLRSPLGRARGLGSAKEGLHHWWGQRITALALIPLTIWFASAVIALAGTGYESFMIFMASPFNATAMILFLGVTFHHANLGMQVIYEDYIPGHALRLTAIILTKMLCYGLAALGIVSTLIVTFGV